MLCCLVMGNNYGVLVGSGEQLWCVGWLCWGTTMVCCLVLGNNYGVLFGSGEQLWCVV